jgi:hypothetical protein
MPIATLRDATASDLLTSISVAYAQDAQGFVASKVFPIVTVDENSGPYWVYNKGDMLRSDARLRAPGAKAALKSVGVTTASYLCNQWALDHKIPDEIARSRKSPFSDQVAVQVLTQDLLIRRDLEWASTFMAQGVWSNEIAGGGGGGQVTSWDQTSATILENIAGWHDTVKASCGRRPNVAVISSDLWAVVKNNADVVDRIKYTQRGQVSLDLFASLIEVDEVLMIDSVQATSLENISPVVTSQIASQSFLLAYRSPTPDILVPSAGYVFSWPEFDQVRDAASAGAAGIASYYERSEEAMYYRAKAHYDMKVVAADAAFLGYNLLA